MSMWGEAGKVGWEEECLGKGGVCEEGRKSVGGDAGGLCLGRLISLGYLKETIDF